MKAITYWKAVSNTLLHIDCELEH